MYSKSKLCEQFLIPPLCSPQDGAERVIESLSLIDAVMPDVVELRKQAAAKNHQIKQIKQEPSDTNGDDAPAMCEGELKNLD